MIKALTIACAALGMFAAGQAFADTTAPAQNAQAQTATTETQVSTIADSGVAQPETRSQVYHDLVHAEQDGQLKQLDSTVYAHH